MKYIKLLMLMVAVTFLGACSSDDDSWNTASDVTVNMQNKTYSTKEGAGLFKLPIVVSGEKNGNVFVTVEVKEVGEHPAKEDVNYYVTGKTINISGATGYVEIETVDDDEINESRTFEVTIVDAKGAKIGENPTTLVTLRDNDSEFYEKLQGKWTMTGVSSRGAQLSWQVTITGATDEDDEDYNKTLYISGLNGEATCEAELTFNFNPETKTGTVSFENLGEYALGAYNFGDPVGAAYVLPYNRKNGKLTTDPIIGTWSDDMKTITFGDGMLEGALFSYPDLQYTGYLFFNIGNIKLTK